jgi:NADPH:quinone reductase-like Zn-dependent oxidoreductase
MAAASLATSKGVRVLATTRGAAKADVLRANGVGDVVIDAGQIAEEVVRRVPGGVDGVLELIGPVTLLDSLRAVRPGGIVCHTGLLGNVWLMERFEPLEDIPSTVRLTTYHSGTTSAGRSTAALQEIVDGVAAGRYRPSVERVFRFDEIVAAHRFMEENRGSGKLVVAMEV